MLILRRSYETLIISNICKLNTVRDLHQTNDETIPCTRGYIYYDIDTVIIACQCKCTGFNEC